MSPRDEIFFTNIIVLCLLSPIGRTNMPESKQLEVGYSTGTDAVSREFLPCLGLLVCSS